MQGKKKYDVVVMGGGIAGTEAAISLAEKGKKVALVEKKFLGGTTYYDGALPVKGLLDIFKENPSYTVDEALKTWEARLQMLDKRNEEKVDLQNITLYDGEGTFVDDHHYLLENNLLEGETFIIATGTKPKSPFAVEIDEEKILSHRYLRKLPKKPEELTILGGSVEGFELAFLFSKLNYKVTLIEKEDQLLFGNDEDLVKPLQKALEKLGCKILTNQEVIGFIINKDNNQEVEIQFKNGMVMKTSKVLLAMARETNIPKGLKEIGVTVETGFLKVNEFFQTNIAHIFAIGDINGIHGMAHVAQDQGKKVALNILGEKVTSFDYSNIPRAVFTLPEMAGTGMQEIDCQREKIPYYLGKVNFQNTYRGWAMGIKEGFVKVLLNQEEQLLGLWLVGERVSEKIGFFHYLITQKITANELLNTLVINPSIDEGLKEAIKKALKGGIK